jgi:short-subunit dehydrogenase
MEETEKMKNKTVLITGGACGLGKELALLLIEKDYPVIVLDKVSPADMSTDFKNKMLDYIQLDLADTNAVVEFIHNDLFRNDVIIDILIINAFPKVFKNFNEFQSSEISDYVNAAFLSQLLIANAVVKKMIGNDFGRIITISSKSNVQGYSTGSLYCSLKSAWMTFHESLSKELSLSNKNVCIATICPDSFADTNREKLPKYDSIIKAIKKRVLAALVKKKSGIYYEVTLKNRIILSYQMFKRFLSIW